MAWGYDTSIENQAGNPNETVLNVFILSLAQVFKTTDVVTLLIETVSKVFLVPSGVYTLLLRDGGYGRAWHSVRYSK